MPAYILRFERTYTEAGEMEVRADDAEAAQKQGERELENGGESVTWKPMELKSERVCRAESL